MISIRLAPLPAYSAPGDPRFDVPQLLVMLLCRREHNKRSYLDAHGTRAGGGGHVLQLPLSLVDGASGAVVVAVNCAAVANVAPRVPVGDGGGVLSRARLRSLLSWWSRSHPGRPSPCAAPLSYPSASHPVAAPALVLDEEVVVMVVVRGVAAVVASHPFLLVVAPLSR